MQTIEWSNGGVGFLLLPGFPRLWEATRQGFNRNIKQLEFVEWECFQGSIIIFSLTQISHCNNCRLFTKLHQQNRLSPFFATRKITL